MKPEHDQSTSDSHDSMLFQWKYQRVTRHICFSHCRIYNIVLLCPAMFCMIHVNIARLYGLIQFIFQFILQLVQSITKQNQFFNENK